MALLEFKHRHRRLRPMLSVLKDKRGFSALFKDKTGAAAQASSERCLSQRGRVSFSGRGRASAVIHQRCQRCSKVFSQNGEEAESVDRCSRCDHLTCLQCREAVSRGPGWMCCVCRGPTSFMWLLGQTRYGPVMLTKIIEFCDPRGGRLLRSMFRFVLHCYTPRTGALSPRAGSTARKMPAVTESSKSPRPTVNVKQLSGERLPGRLVPGATNQLKHPSPNDRPKNAALSSAHPCHTEVMADAGALGKENSIASSRVSASPQRLHGSELLRRTELASRVVEYSPEPPQRQLGSPEEVTCMSIASSSSPPPSFHANVNGANQEAAAELSSAAMPQGYGQRSSAVVVSESVKAERPSGGAAFQREVRRLYGAVDGADAAVGLSQCPTSEANSMAPTTAALVASLSPTPPGQPYRLGGSRSPDSSGSARSASPAPRFPSFVQFLDDQAAVAASDMQDLRPSDLYVMVSPDTEDEGVVMLDGGAGRRYSGRTQVSNGGQTPRHAAAATPVDGSSELRTVNRDGMLDNYTPTRMLDMSSARCTTQRRGSIRSTRGSVRSTRGSIGDLQPPQLYGSGRLSSKHSSPYSVDLTLQVRRKAPSSMSATVVTTRGRLLQRQHAPLATRTSGAALRRGAAHKPAVGSLRESSLGQKVMTSTPLQRTASRGAAFQPVPSRTAPFGRTNSLSGAAPCRMPSPKAAAAFGRLNSATKLVRTPSLMGREGSDRRSRDQPTRMIRTASASFTRTASAYRQPMSARGGGDSARKAVGLPLYGSPPKPVGPPAPQHRYARVNSASRFGRSATAFGDANRLHRTASANGFGRTNTGTFFAGPTRRVTPAHPQPGSARGTRYGEPARGFVRPASATTSPWLRRPQPTPRATPSSAATRQPATGIRYASPLQRSNTGTRGATPLLTRTVTGQQGFERVPSQTLLGKPVTTRPGSSRPATPSAATNGVRRREAPGAAIPSSLVAMGTPRTARTVAATSGPPHSGSRPLLVSGATSPKARSTRDSLLSASGGSRGTDSGSSTAAGIKAPPTNAAAPHRRIGTRRPASSLKPGDDVFSRLATPHRTPSRHTASSGRTGTPSRAFARQQSRLI